MKTTVRTNPAIGETIISFTHSSGLPVYINPKPHATAFAVIAAKFGSCDTAFRLSSEKRFTSVPDGTAHFLEHKLFDSESGENAFERYALTGAEANAYTTFERTAFQFSCTENFDENLSILLDLVTHPYFTSSSVKKETGIICQEIGMYDDDPDWQLQKNLLDALYVRNPVKIDIAGTAGTIAGITPELLYRVHGAFYHPSNMVLCISGNVTPEQVAAVCDACLTADPAPDIILLPSDEPERINRRRVTSELEVAQPLFAVGIKEPVPDPSDNELRRSAEHAILLQMMFGQSGSFYCDAYESGLLTDRFDFGYVNSRDWSYISVEGAADNPDAVLPAVLAEIEKRREVFFTDEEFSRAKKVVYASELLAYTGTADTASRMSAAALEGCDILDYADIIASVTPEDVRKRLDSGYDPDTAAISIVFPRNHTGKDTEK